MPKSEIRPSTSSGQTSLQYKMVETIRRYSMMKSGEKVLVAVSGGPDSVALLYALWSLRDELGITLHVAHLNHSFRGEASDKDAEYVRELAANIGVPCTVEKIDVPEIQKTLRLSAEEAARLVRYEFLERVATDVHADKIALGHTADDQTETVLLNLLRGTGIDGLSGMPPVRGKIIRPLIDVRRSEVEEYIKQYDLHPRIDETNLLPTYTRNKVRLELLPLLRNEYNPEIDTAILRLSELAREDSAYINEEAEEALHQSLISQENGSLTLDPKKMQSLPLAIRRRVIRLAVKAVRGDMSDVGFIHVEELLRLLDVGKDFKYELPGGTFVQRKRGTLNFLSDKPRDIPIIYSHELKIPGETHVPEIQLSVNAEVGTEPVEYMRPSESMEIVLDFGRIVGKLKVRNWEPGDRIRPLGMQGSKKIQDVFVDNKIPREARSRVPLIVDDEKIIWVVGLTISDFAKVTGDTQEYLRLTVERMETI